MSPWLSPLGYELFCCGNQLFVCSDQSAHMIITKRLRRRVEDLSTGGVNLPGLPRAGCVFNTSSNLPSFFFSQLTLNLGPTGKKKKMSMTLERVEGLWFEDGNLILQAENSLFRIYSGFLAARSSVFRDMLAFPAPAEGNAMMDGCHIVTVYDSAKDMTVFLKAIMDSRCVFSCIDFLLIFKRGIFQLFRTSTIRYSTFHCRRRTAP